MPPEPTSDPEGGAVQLVEVPLNYAAARADKVLAKLLPDISRSRWQKLLKMGKVWRDDVIISQSDKVFPGDSLEYVMPDLQPLELRPVPMPLEVLFEDDDLLVINKPAGLVVHPGAGTRDNTLVHGLLHHCRGKLSGIGGVERPGIIHRLDKDTSGVLLVAKSDRCFALLTRQFADRTIEKYYTAIVHGVPATPSASIDLPIGRHPTARTKMAIVASGRSAQTDYSIARSFPPHAALLDLQIHTGRTHQIRVHLQSMGHPVIGDPIYGGNRSLPLISEPVPARLFLHAAKVCFNYPNPQSRFVITAPLPKAFSQLIHALA